ncbi:MAG: aminoacyl-tRNA hydrolase [Hyphomicrobium sp.]|nr:aminoacyl-tRNA hydrolase [Hyphomicrobium sp.]
MKLFVGLGNPGDKYAGHRHNIGFMAVDRIASEHGFGPWRKKFRGLVSEGDLGGARVVLLKPETYMNESGQSVGEAARFLKIEEGNVVIFHDELDLAPGKIKVKTGGGNAGHNGLRSISAHLGNETQRVRLGIGHPGHKDAVSPFVLSDFAKADAEWLDALLTAVAKSAPRLAAGDPTRFLTDVARLTSLEGDKKITADTADTARPAKSSDPGSKDPRGERQSKSERALAANLAKWLKARDKSD